MVLLSNVDVFSRSCTMSWFTKQWMKRSRKLLSSDPKSQAAVTTSHHPQKTKVTGAGLGIPASERRKEKETGSWIAAGVKRMTVSVLSQVWIFNLPRPKAATMGDLENGFQMNMRGAFSKKELKSENRKQHSSAPPLQPVARKVFSSWMALNHRPPWRGCYRRKSFENNITEYCLK